ncbi:MAG: hypothetical protein NTW29_06210 [Bacteroidetes bacterium]|nr:hypothetical protein [Bacteroidota bacterium]
MKRIKLVKAFAFLFFAVSGNAQHNVGIGTASPDASAVLDISSNTKGFLTPRMTLAQKNAISAPATGLLVYQTDGTTGFYYYNGSQWILLSELPGFFNISSTNPNTIHYTDAANYGKNFVVNADDVNYIPGDPTIAKILLHPPKYAFRAGSIDNNNWDMDSLGYSSFAGGYNNLAKGVGTAAFGLQNKANGDQSVAMGYFTVADGWYGLSHGFQTTAPTYGEVTIGSFNTTYTPAVAGSGPGSSARLPYSADRAFTIGTGTSTFNRNDALIVFKDGTIELDSLSFNPAKTVNRLYAYNNNLYFSGRSASAVTGTQNIGANATNKMTITVTHNKNITGTQVIQLTVRGDATAGLSEVFTATVIGNSVTANSFQAVIYRVDGASWTQNPSLMYSIAVQ